MLLVLCLCESCSEIMRTISAVAPFLTGLQLMISAFISLPFYIIEIIILLRDDKFNHGAGFSLQEHMPVEDFLFHEGNG